MYPNHRSMSPQPRPSGYGAGYFLIVILSSFLVLAGAKGFITLTGLSYTVGVPIAAILCLTKMYFLRYQPIIERTINSGWDRFVGYTATAFFLVALAAFGLYCLRSDPVGDSGIVKPAFAAKEKPANTSFPKLSEIQKTVGTVSGVEAFVNDTFAKRNAALGCWIITVIIEISTLILVLHNRPRYLPYY